jgi:hypothetical protein
VGAPDEADEDEEVRRKGKDERGDEGAEEGKGWAGRREEEAC